MASFKFDLSDKLTDDNWLTWSREMKFGLMANGLWDVVTGEEVNVGKDKKALGIIGSSVSAHLAEVVDTSTTSYMVWFRYTALYGQAAAVSVLYTKRELDNIQLLEGETIMQYVTRAQSMQAQLKKAGESVSDKSVLTAILSGLPKEYGLVVSGIVNQRHFLSLGGHDLSVTNVMGLLLQTQKDLKETKDKKEQATALTARGHNRRNNRDGDSGQLSKCSWCHKAGHVEAECRSKARIQSNDGCYKCGEHGHIARNCHVKGQGHISL